MTGKACFKFVLTMVVSVLAFVGCSNSKSIDSGTELDVSVIDITIAQEETYEINDLDALDAALHVTSESSDGSVAVLHEGKYIYALRPGNTLITVNDGTKTENYHVTVTADNNTSKSSINTPPKDELYIGCGFNVLKDDEVNLETIKKNNPILDIDRIYQSENFYMDDTVKFENKTFSGSTTTEFLNSFAKKSTVQAKAKLFGITLFSTKKEFSDLHSDYDSTFKSINQLYLTYQNASYWCVEDEDGYASYLLPEVEKKLKGEDGTSVEDFIDCYGTHVLVGGNYGAFFKCNYVISDAPTSPHKCPANELISKLGGEWEKGSSKTFDYNQWFLELIQYVNPKCPDRDDVDVRSWLNYWNGVERAKDELKSDYRRCYHRNLYSKKLDYHEDYYDLNYHCLDVLNSRGSYELRSSSDYGYGTRADFIEAAIILWDWIDKIYPPRYAYYSDKSYIDGFLPLIGPRNSQSLIPVWDLLSSDYKERKKEFINYVSERSKNMRN